MFPVEAPGYGPPTLHEDTQMPTNSTFARAGSLTVLLAVASSGAVTLGLSQGAEAAAKPKCLFVSSYHRGYAWSDGVERGLRAVLDGKCELKQFDMDTKRKKSEADKKAAARAAKDLVESWRPDVVITADDNAAKYLIKPYFRDHSVPFVFSGVNWTAAEYGFPYENVTGIVEVAPIKPMLERAVAISGGSKALYLGAETLTEKKNLNRFKEAARELGIALDHRLAPTMAAWVEGLSAGQEYDFIVMGSNSGIADWHADKALAHARHLSTKLSVTNHGWMMPFTMLGMTKIPEEHGEWGGQSALAILGGMSPTRIPIVSNRKWDVWANKALLASSGISLPRSLYRKAKKVAQH